ncbi:Crp/Fnr family transcriptional regulator [Kurthia massiliensis]|uniref:Crp/Fnr family transcriptional regulator n=1 Tax=Kurthia massiliensis TaxID=1033739 RepID=UPI0002881421|nr:helix-turn-helix domain-containing protein [Kurthia massiliensis]
MKIIQNDERLQEKLATYHFNHIFPQLERVPFVLQHYDADEAILNEGENIPALLYLVEGKIKATGSVGNGRSLLLRFSHPLAVIGDIEFVRHIPVQSQITAVSDCLFIAVSFQYLRKYEMDNAAFLRHLLTHVTYKLQTNTAASRVNLLAPVDQRFASYLLSVMEGNHFALDMQSATVSDLAELLGTSHRHLNRVIKHLAEAGIIERDRRKIRVLDEAALEQLSEGVRYE